MQVLLLFWDKNKDFNDLFFKKYIFLTNFLIFKPKKKSKFLNLFLTFYHITLEKWRKAFKVIQFATERKDVHLFFGQNCLDYKWRCEFF